MLDGKQIQSVTKTSLRLRKNRRRVLTLLAMMGVASASPLPRASATTYYWDGSNGTAGFGTASGTWAAPTAGTATAGWSTDATGATAISGNSITTNNTSNTSDSINFGTAAAGLGAGTITVSGTVSAGDITFGSASGAIFLSGGTITLSPTNTITVNNASDSIGSVLAGAGTSLTKAGTGTLNLASTSVYSGATIVNGGTLRLNTGIAAANGAVSRYTFNASTGADTGTGGNTLTLNNSPTFAAGINGNAISFANTTATTTPQYAAAAYNANLGLSNYTVSFWTNLLGAQQGNATFISTRNGGDTTFDLQKSATGLHADIGTGSAWLKTNADAAVTMNAGTWYMVTYSVNSTGNAYTIYVNGAQVATSTLGGTALFMKTGQEMSLGTQKGGGGTYGGANNLNALMDEVSIFGSSLSAAQINGLYLSGLNTVAGALTATTPLTIASGSSFDLGGNSQTVASLSDFSAGSGGSVINSGTVPVTMTINPASGSTTFTGVIGGDVAANAITLAKTGAGTQVLAGTNTYLGGTQINGGVLQIASASALGSSGTISFAGGTLQYGAGITTDLSARISTAASQAYSIDTNGQAVTFATPLSSTGGTLTKIGTGALIVSGTNAYTGATQINGGLLQLAAASTLNAASTVTVGGASASGTPALSGTGTASGNVVLSGVGTGAAGHVAPGLNGIRNFGAVGTLNIGGNLTVNSGAAFDLDLGSTGAPNSDQVAVTGTLALPASGVAVNLADMKSSGGATTITNGTYTIATSGTLTGFNASSLAIRNSPLRGGTYTFAQSGNNINLTIAGTTGYASGVGSQVFLGNGNFDALVGLNTNKTYINAVNVQASAPLTINGVTFAASGTGTNPSGTGNFGSSWSTAGLTATFGGGGTNNVTGQIGTMLNTFDYGSNTESVTLNGLTAGQAYVFTFYQRTWDPAGGRVQTITTSDGATTTNDVDFGATGQGSLNLMRYTFVATGANETLTMTAQSNTFTQHVYGFSTEQVFNNTWQSGANWTAATWANTANSSNVVPNFQGANAILPALTGSGGTTITLDANVTVGHIQFDGSNPWTIAGANTLTLQTDTGGVSVLNTLMGTHTISAPLSMSNDAIKFGTGTLVLAGAVTNNSKIITIANGALQFNDGAFTAGTYSGNITDNDTLIFNNTANRTYSGIVSGVGKITKTGAGTIAMTAASTYTGVTAINGGIIQAGVAETAGTSGPLGKQVANAVGTILFGGGSLQYSAANQFDYSGRFSTAAGQLISVDTNGQNVTFATALTSSGGTLTKLGAGTLTLTGLNTYTGVTTLNGGTLNLGSAETAGTSGPLGNSAAANPGSIVLGGGTLQYSAANQFDYSGRFSAAGGQLFSIDTNGQSVTFATPLAGTASTLTKSGTGLLILTGNQSYTGATQVNGGILQLAAASTINAASTVTVGGTGATGSPTLAGTGTASGNVILSGNASGAGGHLAPGLNGIRNFGAVGTLNIGGSLTASSGAVLDLDLGSATANSDQLAVTGTFTLPSSGLLVNLADSKSSGTANQITNATYTIATTGGLVNFSPSDFTVRNSPLRGGTYTFAQSGNNITLAIAGTNGYTQGTFSSVNFTSGAGQMTDTNVGLSTNKTYQNNANINGGALTINGVAFASGGTTSGTNWSLTGAGTSFPSGNTHNLVGGQLGAMINDFTYNGNPSSTLTLNGLTPGQTYVFTSYGASFGTAGTRVVNITGSDGGTITGYDENGSGDGNGLLVRYTFVATGTNETLTFNNVVPANTFHFYGFSNEQVFNNTWQSGANWTASTYSNLANASNVVPNAVGTNVILPQQAAPTTITVDANVTVGHIQFDSSNAWTVAGTNTITLQTDTGGISVLSALTGTHTITAPLSFNNDVIKTGTGTIALGGAVTNNSKAITIAAGALQFNDGAFTANAYSGNIADNDSLVFNNTGNQTYSGVVSGVGAVTKNGAGTLTVSGANTYTGATIVSAGTLKAGSSTAFTAKGVLSMSGSGIFDLGGFNASFTDITASAATNTITNTGGANTALTLTAQNSQISSVIQDGPTNTTAIKISNSLYSNSIFNLTTQSTYSGGLTLLNGAGSGTRLRISSTFTTVGSPGAITSSPFGRGPITIGTANTDKAQILLDTVNGITIANDIVVNSALGTDVVGAFRFDTTGHVLSGKITANLANLKFGGGGAASLTGQITGPFGIDHTGGAATITLSNATANPNNYQGDTNIGSTGTLALGVADQIPNGAGTGNLIDAGTFKLNGFSETINGLSGAGTVDGVSGTPTFTVGDNNATGAANTFSGVIKNTAGTLALTKTGTGTLILSGANTYGGVTTISGGTLQIGSGGTTGTLGSGSVTDNAALVFTRTDEQTVNNVISGTGSLSQSPASTNTASILNLFGANSYQGGTSITAGSIRPRNASAFGTGAVTVSNGALVMLWWNTGSSTMSNNFVLNGISGSATGDASPNTKDAIYADGGGGGFGTYTLSGQITLNATSSIGGDPNNNLIVSGKITGPGGLSKGAGRAGATNVVTLSNTGNDYVGNTSVVVGTLKLGASGVIPDGVGKGNVSVASTLDIAGFTETINGLSGAGTIDNTTGNGALTVGNNDQTSSFTGLIKNTAGTLSLTKMGSGTLTLSGSNTYTGGTFVTGGVLNLDDTGKNGSTPVLPAGTNLTVTGATVNLIGGQINSILNNGAGTITLNAGGTLNANSPTLNAHTVFNVTLNGGTLTAGNGTFVGFAANYYITGSISATDNSTISATIGFVTNNGSLPVSVAASKALLISGPIVNLSGANGLTKTGAGTLNLTGNNTYTGVIDFAAGIVNVANLTDYGVNGSLGARTAAQETATGSGIGLHFTGGTLQYTGSTPQSTNREIRMLTGNGATIDASGSVPSATLSFTHTGTNINLFDTPGARILTLTGSNTGDNLFAISLSDAGGGTGLTKSGTGTWVLTGSSSATGTFSVLNGTLKVSNIASGGNLGTTGSVVLGDASNQGTLEYTGNSVAFLRGFTIGAGGGRINTTTSGQTLTVQTAAITGSTGNLTIGGAGDTNITSIINTGTGSVTKLDAGTAYLSGNNTYSGGTFLNAGVLNIGSNTALGAIPASATTNLTFTDNGTLQAGAASISLPVTRNVAINSGITGRFDTNGNTMLIGGVISGASAAGFTKAGAGTMILGANESYAGPTTITGGILQLATATAGGATLQNGNFESPPIGSNSFVYWNAFSGAGQTAFVWAGSIATNGGLGFALENASTAWGYAAAPSGPQAVSLQRDSSISQTINFAAAGYYQLTWSNASRSGQVDPYNVLIDANNLGSFSTNNTAWTSATTGLFYVSTPGNHTFTFAGTITASDVSVGIDAITLTGLNGGLLPSTTAVNITGSTGVFDLNGRTQTIGSLAGVAGSGVINNGALTTGGDNSSTVFAGVLSGAGTFTKTGTGTQSLSGFNTYNGQIVVNNGMLHVTTTGRINSATGVTINAGEFKYNSSTPYTGGAITFNGGTISGTGTIGQAVSGGSGTFISPGNSPGAQTYSAGINFSGGMTYVWQLGAYGTSAGTDSDLLNVTGGALTVGGSSNLSIVFDNSANPLLGNPDNGNAFWNSAHTWKIVDVDFFGGATNIGGTFANMLNGSFTTGSFTQTVGTGSNTGDIFLKYTVNGTSLAVAPTTFNLGNVLRNSTHNLSTTLTNSGAVGASYNTSGVTNLNITANASGTVAGNGNTVIAFNANSLAATNNSNATGSFVVHDNGTDTNTTVNVTASVGFATALRTESNSSLAANYGAPLTAIVAAGETYANLESTVSSPLGIGETGAPVLGTVATILAGVNDVGGVDRTVSMAWRSRTTGESGLLDSDVVNLTGIDGTIFVLQMSYDEAVVAANSQSEESLFLGYFSDSGWVNAILGDHGTNLGTHYLGAWSDTNGANSTLVLGSWGVDTTSNVVWAVLDHNSEFAVIPEPLALPGGLMLLSLVGVLSRRRKA